MPEVIEVPVREIVYFFSVACPSFLLGVGVGIAVYARNLRKAGYELKFNYPRRTWHVIAARTGKTLGNE